MTERDRERAQAIAELERECRKFHVQMGVFERVFAERLGLNRTDVDVLMLLQDAGSMTAGDIAQATSLTTGAVTAVIDRLEKSGHAQRERAPGDRRQVVVKLAPERRHQIAQALLPLLRRSVEAYSDLSERELVLLTRFLRKACPLLDRETTNLRAEAQPGVPMDAAGRDFSAPLGSATNGRLEVRSGASRLRVCADLSMPDLFRAHFEGRVPAVRTEGGTVAITYRRSRAVERREHAGDVALNGSVSWEMEIRGGVSKLTADLATLQLRSLDVGGGASDVAATLPRPSGTVRIAFSGGASRVFLQRPRGVAARIRVSGGVSRLAFDALRLGAVDRETRLESSGYASAEDRYDVTVSGGGRQLAIQAHQT